MNVNKLIRFLFKAARILGDINAVKGGTYGKRVARRTAKRTTRKMVRSLFK
ncbi:hypothetical protein [Virgibacillus sediminis]|uniref:Uncharacterized protein n=1 Tax=Virgibacillus sediminis TaxID=202260 RepID=A0ABV7A4I3_9BACI